ncbi:MAG: IPT/TIG domain-containing protein [Solirubrobacteraceae bacterium]
MGARGTRRAVLCAVVATAAAMVAPQASLATTSTFAWGPNAFGQLGVGFEAKKLEYAYRPLAIGGLGEVVEIAGGEDHAVAVDAEGTAAAWGANGHGQLGNGTTAASDVPVTVPGLDEAKAVAAGNIFSLALLGNGTVESWGANAEGQLGLGSNTGPQTCGSAACSTVPVEVPGLSGVRAIAASGNHALALLENGTVESWGSNKYGQVGDGTTTEKNEPVAVPGITEAVAIAAGTQSSLAVLSDGEVRTWGRNNYGQLGNGTTTDSHSPVSVTGISEAVSVAAGESFALALLRGGQLKAWGSDGFGELGDGGKAGYESTTPVAVSGLSGVTAIAAAGSHSVALLSGATVETWGYGALGNGTHSGYSKVPVTLTCDLTGLVGIGAGVSTAFTWGEMQETCPVVESVTPAEGAPAGGTAVTIRGSTLGGVSQVMFGSTPASSFEVVSPTEIAATAPAGSETVDVTVLTARAGSEVTKADWFTYAAQPTVSSLVGRSGPAGGGTRIEIKGTNLGNVSAVHFGDSAAASFTVVSDHEVTATSPAGQGGTVDVTVTNPVGTSEANASDQFTYTEAPEFGRCAGGGGNYSDKGCEIEGEVKFNFEWFPGFGGSRPLVKRGFTLSASTLTLESVGKRKITCSGAHGAGEFTAAKATAISSLVLTGCSGSGLGSCHSAAAGEGEVRLEPLAGKLGYTTKKTQIYDSGLQVGPASGEELAEFTCASHTVRLTGAFVGLYGKEDTTTTSMTLAAKDKKGVQEQLRLKEQPEVSLALKVDGGAAEKAGIKAKLAQTNEEGVEVNTEV